MFGEVKMKPKPLFVVFFLFVFAWGLRGDGFPLTFDRYHPPDEITQALKKLSVMFPEKTAIHRLSMSPGENPVMILELGTEIGKPDRKNPAILVVANLNGITPISSEGAMKLIQLILGKGEVMKDRTWYVLPMGNPDAAKRFFSTPLLDDSRNLKPHNDDMDDRVDEDPVEDLNGDQVVSMMRVKDPAGTWIPIPGEPRLMKKADWSKGEKGVYKLYTEGIDNDGDGQYNEDGRGGVNIAVNFPHLFRFFTKSGGLWAGSEPESFGLFKFIFDRKEIAMTVALGESNFCLIPPRGGRKGTADFSKIKIPARIGKRMNIDVSRTYTMEEVMAMVKRFVPSGFEITESMVASFLGLGAMVNPQPADLKFYTHLSEEYKEFLKKNKLDADRLDPPKAKDGSFELWSYYHLGIPSFSLDFWTLPEPSEKKKKESDLTPEKLEKMSNEDFIALGEEKIDSFLKSAGAPANVKASMILNAVKNGMMTPKRMADMLRKMPKPKSKEGGDPVQKALLEFSDKELEGKGYLQWTPFQHPSLGPVEIGGAMPFASNTPPPRMIKSLLDGQVPWILNLSNKIPRIKIGKTEVTGLGHGLFRLKVWIKNQGYLPYPTEMGNRNNQILPVVVTIGGKDIEILEGKERELVDSVPGNGCQSVSWMLYSRSSGKVIVESKTRIAGRDSVLVDLGGSQ